MSTLQELYNDFNKYRTEECEYALDGFVIKPILPVREQNTDKVRPSDCVAVKFVPEIQKTKVVDIVWNQGKTGEYTPVIVFEPVVLLDKIVTKCSGHNYGYLIDNQVGIGTEIEVSLAGDIIPFLYSVLDNPSKDLGSLPNDAVVEGCHLVGLVSNRGQFIASAQTLKIPNIGPSVAAALYDTLQHNFESLTNILQVRPEQIEQALKGKRGQKAAESFKNYRRQITLVDIIKSLNFNKCGSTCAKKCAQFIGTGQADFSGVASEGYSWVYNHQSPKWLQFNALVNALTDYGIGMCQLTNLHVGTSKTTQVPVMLTGSPSKYASKKEFLEKNPQYVQTNSWSDAKVLFTGDINSTSSKMLKANKLGLRIELY
jgi:NAD-dependent DNA ligase